MLRFKVWNCCSFPAPCTHTIKYMYTCTLMCESSKVSPGDLYHINPSGYSRACSTRAAKSIPEGVTRGNTFGCSSALTLTMSTLVRMPELRQSCAHPTSLGSANVLCRVDQKAAEVSQRGLHAITMLDCRQTALCIPVLLYRSLLHVRVCVCVCLLPHCY